MSDVQDSWKDIAGKAEALGLKLKLHLEQEADADSERQEGDTKALIDELGQRLSDAFDGVGNAAKDPAVHEDVKDIGRMFKDALMTTFSAAGAEVQSRTQGMVGKAADAATDVQDAVAEELESGSGDESDGGDA